MFQTGRRNRTIWVTLFFLLVSLPTFSVYAQGGRDLNYSKNILRIQGQGEPVHPIEKDISPNIKLIMPGGAFPNWSPATNKITFTKIVGNQYEVFVMNANGENSQCLTCNKPALKDTRHRGQSYWHLSDTYIVFSAESGKFPRQGIGVTARPGLGRNFNVWVMTADGQDFWRLTDYPDNWGVIETKFSHDGTKIYWNEEYSMEIHPKGKPGDPVPHPGSYWGTESLNYRKGEEIGAWRVVVADITFEGGDPKISNIRKINPPVGFTAIEANGFTPDDKGSVWSLDNLQETRGRCFWGEIYVSDLEGKNWKKLTSSPWRHDEDPAYSPDGKKIVYKEATKGRGMPQDGMEIFLMDADGSNRVQLTHFSDPEYPEYRTDWMQITEFSWSPNGKKIVYGMARGDKESPKIFINSDLYILTLPDGK